MDSRKGVLLASYSRKKTKRRKKGKDSIGNIQVRSNKTQNEKKTVRLKYDFPPIQSNSRSVTPSPLPSPNANIRPPPTAPVHQQQQQQRTRGLTSQGAPNQTQNPNTLHPLGMCN